MKLQELLDKHKDKLWDWRFSILTFIMDCDWIWRIEKQPYYNVRLSELLFDTPFLSLLEWRKWWSLWAERDNINWLSMKTLFWGSSDYHKINLVLLNTDAERIKYIEAFTL